MRNKYIQSTLIFLFSIGLCQAQSVTKYWVSIDADQLKLNSDFSIDTLEVESVSNWLNAFTVKLTEDQKNTFSQNNLVTDVSKVRTLEYQSVEGAKYGDYVTTLNPEYLDSIGLDGTGVIAGVIDGGFVNVDSGRAFQHFISGNRILGYKDFIDEDREDFFEKVTSADNHGANVLAYMGGYDLKTKQRIGLATGASFYLARTEDGDKEHLVEEDNWIEAIEWMHSKGVRVVNTSLGYSEFDDSTENHTVADMNGRTTKISIAAQKAVEKGMILVCSAGNLGHKEWKYVSAPADAEGVISVGATKKDDFSKEFYSSVGPEYNTYIKPDISTYSDRGTSYASPEIAGLVACMLQRYPNMTSQEVKDALAVAGSMNPLPNNFVGYGVPDVEVLFDYLAGKEIKTVDVERLNVRKDFVKIKIKCDVLKNIIVYDKTDNVHVKSLRRIIVKDKKGEFHKILAKKGNYEFDKKKKKTALKLFKPEDVNVSTVIIGNDLIEILWK